MKISIVGCDPVPFTYYRAKTAQEPGQSPLPVPPLGRVVRRLRDAALCLDNDGETVSFDYAEWLRRRCELPGIRPVFMVSLRTGRRNR